MYPPLDDGVIGAPGTVLIECDPKYPKTKGQYEDGSEELI
jgi:hypothetical protein